MVAEVDATGPTPALRNRQVLLESPDNRCTLEAQDFYAKDQQLTYTCYEGGGKASVWTIDRQNRKPIHQSSLIGNYNEVEGIFPDGRHTLVESDQQAIRAGWPGQFRNIDIWKLALDAAAARASSGSPFSTTTKAGRHPTL